jgi:hypothetical protein
MKTMFEDVQTMQSSSESKMEKQTMPGRLSRRRVVVSAAIIVLGGLAWYLFRPELLFVNQRVNEGFPATKMTSSSSHTEVKSKAVATGMFHKGAHETKGTATIHQLSDGTRLLRLTDFETSNGPDVHVYLVAANDATDSETVKSAGYVDLGSLKGNVGDQNYEIAADLDLSKYQAVTIWCARFGVNFGTAPLQ